MCCSPLGHKELDTIEWLNSTELKNMEKLERLHDVARMQMCSVTMENGVEIPQKTKTGTNI